MQDDPYTAPTSQPLRDFGGDLGSGDLYPATHGKRWLAAFLDNLIIGLPLLAGFVLVLLLVGMMDGGSAKGGVAEQLLGLALEVGMLGVMVLYGAVFESSGWQATPGKRIMGLRVVGTRGEPLSFGAALGRNLTKGFVVSMCWIASISVLLDDEHRGLWDMAAGSRVVSGAPW